MNLKDLSNFTFFRHLHFTVTVDSSIMNVKVLRHFLPPPFYPSDWEGSLNTDENDHRHHKPKPLMIMNNIQ